MADYEVRSLAELREIVGLYRQFPVAFLELYRVEVSVRAVDSVANAFRMYNLLRRSMVRYGWTSPRFSRLAYLAALAEGLTHIADKVLLPLFCTFHRDNFFALAQDLTESADRMAVYGERSGSATRTLRRLTARFSFRVRFTVRNAGAWDDERILSRLEAHADEAYTILGLQVSFAD